MSVLFKPYDVFPAVKLAQQAAKLLMDSSGDMRAVSSGNPFSDTEHDQPVLKPHLRHLAHKHAGSFFFQYKPSLFSREYGTFVDECRLAGIGESTARAA